MLHSLIRRKKLKYDYFSVSFCRTHLFFFFDFLQTTFDYYLQSPIRGYNHTTLPKLGLLQYFYFLQIKFRDVCHMIFAVKDSIIYLSDLVFRELSFQKKDFLFYCVERRNHRNAVPVGKWWRLFYFFKGICLVKSPYMAAKNIYSMSHMKMEWLRKNFRCMKL